MYRNKVFHFGLVLVITLALLFAPTISCNVYAATQQSEVMYSYGVHKIDKVKLIKNIRANASSYIDYMRNHGWSSYYVEEFQHAYTRYMAALDDPRNPYRFYSDDFGNMTDTKGEFNNQDYDDYWYDNRGQRISGYEYSNLKESKKKNYHKFNANMQFVKFFNQIAEAMIKK